MRTCRIGWLGLLALTTVWADGGQFTWQSEGVLRFIGSYKPRALALSPTPPASLKAPPAGATALRYTELAVGPVGEQRFVLAVESSAGRPGRLWADTNGTGELSPAARWEQPKNPPGLAGSGSFVVQVKIGGVTRGATFRCYQFTAEARPNLADKLLVYPDCGWTGTLKVGELELPAALYDPTPSLSLGPPQPKSSARLYVDRNHNGRVDKHGEDYDPAAPFNLGGVTWEISSLASDGLLTAVKSTRQVAELPLPLDLRVGHVAPSFKARTLAGQALTFPDDFKGKVVLLDFWATWCGPCRAEIPNVVATYSRFRAKGFEVLGISLDQPDQAAMLRQFLSQNSMGWAQIYDGKGWQAEIARLYEVDGIPAMYLIDGSTGKVLANSPRGPALPKAVEAALAK